MEGRSCLLDGFLGKEILGYETKGYLFQHLYSEDFPRSGLQHLQRSRVSCAYYNLIENLNVLGYALDLFTLPGDIYFEGDVSLTPVGPTFRYSDGDCRVSAQLDTIEA